MLCQTPIVRAIDHLKCVSTAGEAQAASRKTDTEAECGPQGTHLLKCHLFAGCVALDEVCNILSTCSSAISGVLLEPLESGVRVPQSDARGTATCSMITFIGGCGTTET